MRSSILILGYMLSNCCHNVPPIGISAYDPHTLATRHAEQPRT